MARRAIAHALWPQALAWLVLAAVPAHAAPDEDSLGKADNYAAGHNLVQAYQERYRVGSFSAMDSLTSSCRVAPSPDPVPLPRAAAEPEFRYSFRNQRLSMDDYMRRQRATALLVVKDGEIAAERYNYGRDARMRMLSNSMAKTLVALMLQSAVESGEIRSLDDTAATYVPALAGSLYGETRIVDLMRMASGARFVEDYSANDDRARYNAVARRAGTIAAARTVTERADPPGERFNYASAQTAVLGLVLRGATGKSLCENTAQRIWQPIGAASGASWLVNPADGVETAQGGFNATAHDYARLGVMLADDGLVRGRAVVSREHLLDMTDAQRQPEAFRPGRMVNHGSTYIGYGLQTWLLPGSHRKFVLLGVYGQAIYVDPLLKLVVVHLAVGKDASGNASGSNLGAEREALFRGIVAYYGTW